jgi:hemophore-related protein
VHRRDGTYLDAHPGANQAVTAAMGRPRDQAAVNLRGYFTAHPQEYYDYDLRGILAPVGDAQRQCNVSVLPPDLASAYRARSERGPVSYLLAPPGSNMTIRASFGASGSPSAECTCVGATGVSVRRSIRHWRGSDGSKR